MFIKLLFFFISFNFLSTAHSYQDFELKKSYDLFDKGIDFYNRGIVAQWNCASQTVGDVVCGDSRIHGTNDFGCSSNSCESRCQVTYDRSFGVFNGERYYALSECVPSSVLNSGTQS